MTTPAGNGDALGARQWLPRLLSGRPHQLIGEDDPYLLRWFIVPRNPLVNVYGHRFVRSDPSVPHDHPWAFISLVLRGRYREVNDRGSHIRRVGSLAVRRSSARHRVELIDGPVTTVIVTGPRTRQWGFWCPRARQEPQFVPWQEFGTGGCGDPTGSGAATARLVARSEVVAGDLVLRRSGPDVEWAGQEHVSTALPAVGGGGVQHNNSDGSQ
jgi:hypothetical protein